MSKCTVGYEVHVAIKSLKTYRDVIFTSRSEARKFQRKWHGSTLTAVELCDGKIKRRGKRSY